MSKSTDAMRAAHSSSQWINFLPRLTHKKLTLASNADKRLLFQLNLASDEMVAEFPIEDQCVAIRFWVDKTELRAMLDETLDLPAAI